MVLGFQLLTNARNLPKEAEALIVALKLEEYRLLNWGEVMNIAKGRQIITESHVEAHLLNALRQCEESLSRFIRFELRANTVEDNTQPSSDTNDSRVGKVRFPQESRSLRDRSLVIVEAGRRYPSRLRWALSDKRKLQKLLENIRLLNDYLQRLMTLSLAQSLAETQQQTHFRILQLNNHVDSLLKLAEASHILPTNPPIQTEGSLSNLNNPLSPLDTLARSKILLSRLDEGGTERNLERNLQIPPEDLKLWFDGFQNRRMNATLGSKSVWVEYVPYSRSPRLDLHRAEAIATILHSNRERLSEFHIPYCIGYVVDGTTVGYVFEIPLSTSSLVSLLDLLKLNSTQRPSLTARVTLALAAAEALQYLHSINWLHKEFRSDNVLFILSLKEEFNDSDIENPVICGFDHEKDNSDYQHPEVRQHWSPIPFKKTHDVYSLGVLLLEICLWLPIDSLQNEFPFGIERNFAFIMEESSPMYKKVQQHAGNSFAAIIHDCLTGTASFSLSNEDDQLSEVTGSQIQKQYYQKVIKPLKALVSALSPQSQEELPPTPGTLPEMPAPLSESKTPPLEYAEPIENSDSAPPISRLPHVKDFLSDPSAYFQRLELIESRVIELSSFTTFFQPTPFEVGTWSATALLELSFSDLQSRDAIEALAHYSDQHLSNMHRIQECLESLREAGLFESTYNIIVTGPFRQSVSRVVPISSKMIDSLVEASNLVGGTLRYYSSNPRLSLDWQLIQEACQPLLTASNLFLNYLCPGVALSVSDYFVIVPLPPHVACFQYVGMANLVHLILLLGMVSYVRSHIGHFDMICDESHCEKFVIRTDIQNIYFRRQRLACLDAFIPGPVWTFDLGEVDPTVPHYLSITVLDFADIWGPSRVLYGNDKDLDMAMEISVRGGAIRAVDQATSSVSPAQGETLCHWYSWDDEKFDKESTLIPFDHSSRLLIGSPKSKFRVNPNCAVGRPYLHSLRNCFLGTAKEHWRTESRQQTFSVAKIVGLALGRSQKLHPNITLKDVILEDWFVEPSRDVTYEPDPSYLDQLAGLEISNCTGNARRVRLWDLLRDPIVITYLTNTYSEGWRFIPLSREPSSFTEVWMRNTDEHDFLKCIVYRLLGRLKATGIRHNGSLAAWYAPSNIGGKTLEPTWAQMVKDQPLCATFALLSDSCLEYAHCRTCGSARFQNEPATQETVLLTQLLVSLDRPFNMSGPGPQDATIQRDRNRRNPAYNNMRVSHVGILPASSEAILPETSGTDRSMSFEAPGSSRIQDQMVSPLHVGSAARSDDELIHNTSAGQGSVIGGPYLHGSVSYRNRDPLFALDLRAQLGQQREVSGIEDQLTEIIQLLRSQRLLPLSSGPEASTRPNDLLPSPATPTPSQKPRPRNSSDIRLQGRTPSSNPPRQPGSASPTISCLEGSPVNSSYGPLPWVGPFNTTTTTPTEHQANLRDLYIDGETWPLEGGRGAVRLAEPWKGRRIELKQTYENDPVRVTYIAHGLMHAADQFIVGMDNKLGKALSDVNSTSSRARKRKPFFTELVNDKGDENSQSGKIFVCIS
jgi:serine/threonine protein kinase